MTENIVIRIRTVFEDTPEVLSTLDVETYEGAEAHTHMLGMWDTMKEAADRIEQLTKRMHSSENTLKKIVNGDLRLAEKMGTKVRYSPADERLVERVRKMEAALQEIANPANWEGMDWISHGVPKWIARAALEKEHD